MNRIVALALLEDAWRQVLDNKVFRLLAILVFVPVATTFLIGFHDDRVELLFGVWGFAYDDALWMFGGRIGGVDAKELAIQSYQSVVIQWMGGLFGLVSCIAATAFFVPRMMEKGSADLLFSKPVSRFALLASRYVSGLLFVGVLACLLVFGMYLGFALVSGYSDAGFLWAALTLIYLFAILHAFSIAIGTVTRSSAAAIFLTLALFMVSGCVHGGWMVKEMLKASELEIGLDEQVESDAPPSSEEEVRAALEAERHAIVRVLEKVLDTLHYILPKTTEAEIITNKLKDAVINDPFLWNDEEGGLRIRDHPEGFELVEGSESDVTGAGLVWRGSGEAGNDLIKLRRRPMNDAQGRRMTAGRSASLLADELEQREDLLEEPAKGTREVAERDASFVTWTEAGRRRALVFLNVDTWVYEFDLDVDAETHSSEDLDRAFRRFQRGMVAGSASPEIGQEWFMQQYGWDAPLPYNLFFSIASSVAFALAMFGWAAFKLHRVDF